MSEIGATSVASFFMQSIESFKDKHQGESCAVLGGGVTLPIDLRKIDPVDRLIGVNQHAMILDLDYLVFRDRHMHQYVKDLRDVWLVTQTNTFKDDHVIHAGIAPFIGYSGAMAIWVADYLGFDKIWICGMDQYDRKYDDREYWWDGPQRHKGGGIDHKVCASDLSLLKKFLDEQLKHPERVYFISGRLKELHQ